MPRDTAGPKTDLPKRKVLFLCTGNSCRSQMAEGFLRLLGADRFEAASAGTQPAGLNPMAVEVMREAGVEIASQRSKAVSALADLHFDHVITVCDQARESCPVFPAGTERLHWSLEDPAKASGTVEKRRAFFRKVRDEIFDRVRAFIAGEVT